MKTDAAGDSGSRGSRRAATPSRSGPGFEPVEVEKVPAGAKDVTIALKPPR